nr:WG repeat-containing protein [Clostridia bacterium]
MKKLLICLMAMMLCLPGAYGQEPVGLEEIGCIYVVQDGLWGLLDLDGNPVIAPEWDALYSLDEERTLWAAFRGEMVTNLRGLEEPGDGLWALYSVDGTELSPLQWTKIGNLTDGLMLVEKDGLMGVLDTQGDVVIPVEWEYIQTPALGLIVVRRDGMSGVLDASGTEILPLTACQGMYVNVADGTIRIRQGTEDGDEQYARSGVFDLTGKEIVPCIWGDIGDFSEGLAAVRDGGAWGYVNLQGELVIPCVWSYAQNFYSGYAVVEDGLYGIIDTTGTLVEPCVWERLEPQGDGWFEGRMTVTFELPVATDAD